MKAVVVYHRKAEVPAGTCNMWDFEAVARIEFPDDKEYPLDGAWLWTQNFGPRSWWQRHDRLGMTILVEGYCRPTMNGDMLEMDGQHYIVGKDFHVVEPITVVARTRTRAYTPISDDPNAYDPVRDSTP